MGEFDDLKHCRKIILPKSSLFVPNPLPPPPLDDAGLNSMMRLAVRATRPLPINTGLPKPGLIEWAPK